MKFRLPIIVLIILTLWVCKLLPTVMANSAKAAWSDYSGAIAAGEKAFEQGKHNAAILAFQAALNFRPDQIKPRFRLGQSLLATNVYSDACFHFQKILDTFPNNINARLLYSQCLIGMQKTSEAREHLNWILTVQPEHQEAKSLIMGIVHPRNQAVANSAPEEGLLIGAGESPSQNVIQSQNQSRNQNQNRNQILNQNQNQNIQQKSVPQQYQENVVAADPKSSVAGPQILPAEDTPPQNFAAKSEQKTAVPVPPMAENSKSWKVQDFLDANSDSFAVNLEFSKYCLERDELKKAGKYLSQAEEIAVKERDNRKFLETSVFKSLLFLYDGSVRQFGEGLMKIKPLLSKETYSSFLDIYNKVGNATSPVEVARLVGGVAMGTEHFSVAARILKEVVNSMPGDELAISMLARCQMESLDFQGAEQFFLKLVKFAKENPENHLNLARFYLTVNFNPEYAGVYAGNVLAIDKTDARAQVILSLAQYCQGKSKDGIERLKNIPTKNLDPETAGLIKRVLIEVSAVKNGQITSAQIAEMMAIPGSGGKKGIISFGEEFLRRGSEFHALRYFMQAKDLAEVGRGWLALSSHLFRLGDEKASARAAGCGLNALNQELSRSGAEGKAHLYMALYYFERRDSKSSKQCISDGLKANPAQEVKRRLLMLQSQMG
ncbi:MAG: tetratricopeptide repeat protein [Candidatus Riflebacteria bacterium]|nr:tetratricopeptide repeat protein [Candidatus Riflebacteria bacterium]